MKIEEHAWLTPPTDEEIRTYSIVERVDEQTAEVKLLEDRAAAIAAEKQDPLRIGWEPNVWMVADALLGQPCENPHWDAECRRRWGMSADAAGEKLRVKLGFHRPVTNLLIMGANRSGKSEYTAKLGVRVMMRQSSQKVIWCHQTGKRSKEDQQPLIYKYLPVEMRADVKSAMEYIKYKEKTGFSDNGFILRNASKGYFRTYAQDVHDALQGVEPNAAFPDELVPEEWIQFLKVRVGTRDGFVCTSFTPVEGYTPTVKSYCDGMETVLWSVGYCLPSDGQPPDVARALGMNAQELAVVRRCHDEKIVAPFPRSRPEDIFGQVLDEGRFDGGEMPAGRSFERVPRIARGYEDNTAIIWFHGRDNPYGNPRRVIEDAVSDKRGREWVLPIVYGVATKAHGAVFNKFRKDLHVVPDRSVPRTGTNYMLMDPHGDRSWFMGWIRCADNGKNFTYREWPGSYDIPGVGVPGPWAKPSGRKNGRNDGDKGEGQTGQGFGLLRYKFEIARLEGWEDWKRWRRDNAGLFIPESDDLREWNERNGSEEVIYRRYIDPRAGSTASVQQEQPRTLVEELEEIGLEFTLAPGTGVSAGLELVVNALDFNETAEIGFTNSPRLYCAGSCKNSIFMFENYQNVEGDKGAMKEPADIHRWFYVAGCNYVGEVTARGERSAEQLAERERLRAEGKHPIVHGAWEDRGVGSGAMGSGRMARGRF
jgi:hypothetical protein